MAIIHPDIQLINYGGPGTGKSTFAATFPSPMLVCCFDPPGKALSYLKKGVVSDIVTDGMPGFAFREAYSKKDGSLLTRVEFYFDDDIKTPVGFNRFIMRATTIPQECREGKWKTVVLDSITYLELLSRKLYQYSIAPDAKETKWYAGSTEQIEEIVLMRAPFWLANVIVIAHIDSDKDEVLGSFVHNPSMPGRMRTKAACGYTELYRSYVERDEAGIPQYKLQTATNSQYMATSQIKAPDAAPSHYECLWAAPPTEKEAA